MAMIPYTVDGVAGVLTALYRQAYSDDPNTVYFSPDGRQLVYGNPADYYSGPSNVTAMIPYTDHNGVAGVLTAFSLGGATMRLTGVQMESICGSPPMGELPIKVMHRRLS